MKRYQNFIVMVLVPLLLLALLTWPAYGQAVIVRMQSLLLEHDLQVLGAAAVTGDTTLAGDLAVTGDSDMTGDLTVDGTLTATDWVTSSTSLALTDNLDVAGNTYIDGTLGVTSTATIAGETRLNGGIRADTSTFYVANGTGNTYINGTLTVTGTSTLAGQVAANGGIRVDSTKFYAADGTGNTSIDGTLGVTGTTTLNGGASVAGFLTLPAAANLTFATGTNNKASTVLGSWQPITATNAVTPSFGVATIGRVFCLHNIGTARIWVTDSTTTTLTSPYHLLEQYDTLCLRSDGTRNNEISFANN
jgi:hypothetical protein